MAISTDDVRRQLRLGEDSRWEFKQIEFRGERPVSPRRDDLADELAAFANARGGVLVCGVTDDGEVQGMSRAQMDALDRILSDACADSIKPPIVVEITRHELGDGKPLLVVEVAPGDAQHDSPGGSYQRVGSSKRRMPPDQRLRLAQQRGQSRFLWFDRQPVPETGFETLSERLWKPLVSVAGAVDPPRALQNLRLLALDDGDALRATVAGILLCSETPEKWFPNAVVMATRYRGVDRASGQLDAQEIVGPLQRQLADAVRFAVRNMRVAARKAPGRIDMPQYSAEALFEALVNAVAHRDYSISGRRIRLSMFNDRLEIDSPGALPNGMTIANMEASQATRNEVIASVFGRLSVGDVPGSENRQFLMERRGDGVMIIVRRTRETAGRPPVYALIDESNLQLTIPAAELEPTPARAVITVRSAGQPLAGVEILALFPNRTWQRAATGEAGEAAVELHSTHLPMTVYAAAPGYAAHVEREWTPSRGALALELPALPQGGAAIFPEAVGHLPGLRGRLNPKLDALERTYLYADNISINDGTQQPVHFAFGEDLRLTDAFGYELLVRIVDIAGRSALVEYRAAPEGEGP
ncbi:MAG: putative DNA binding domain-containing protein [Acidobacteria bacterium]|nr:putative DNA binding domain-containing protein [Acidobacteriota bacterium]